MTDIGATVHPPKVTPTFVARLRRRLARLGAHLSSPTSVDLGGRNPVDVTRRVGVAAGEAADVLNRTRTIEWDAGRRAGHLSVEPLRADPDALGDPWVAEGVVRRRRTRSLAVCVAIFDDNRDRCVVQIRPGYRTPWSVRRLRRCLASTHDAADRIRELLMAVDFAPPNRPVDEPPGFGILGRNAPSAPESPGLDDVDAAHGGQPCVPRVPGPRVSVVSGPLRCQ
jgi:hypothetical protein